MHDVVNFIFFLGGAGLGIFLFNSFNTLIRNSNKQTAAIESIAKSASTISERLVRIHAIAEASAHRYLGS